jgi:uncharacterized protein (TIGR02099 family)
MSPRLRRHLRFARRGLWYGLALALVAMALAAGVASQLLPLVERHPERVAAWLSERAGRPVAFDRVKTAWTRRGPLLRLDGLRIGTGANAIPIGAAEVLVSQYAGLLPGRSFTELRLRGLDLTLLRGDDGRWSVRGLPGQQQPDADPLSALQGLGELQVIGGKLAVLAPALGIDARLPRIDLRLRVDGERVRAGMHAWMRPGVSPLEAVLDFDRIRGDGRAYAGARHADLAAWTPLLHLLGVAAEAGTGRAEVWAELRDHRVRALTTDAQLDNVVLRGAPTRDPRGRVTLPRSRFARVQARARWRVDAEGWRLDAPVLRIGTGASTQRLDGVVLAGGKRVALLAERIDAGPLLEIAALSDRLPPGLRHWLVHAKPTALLEHVEVAGQRHGPLRMRGRIAGLGFAPVGDAPGWTGLGGELLGDADGFSVALDPQARTRFDWPRGFGVAHAVRLRGRIGGWRDGAGWRVATEALRVDGEVLGQRYGADLRGGLWFQGDGSRPWLALAATTDALPVAVAKGFWIHHRMPQAALQWLDAALLDGQVQQGRALVSGDLDDWPFKDHKGLFRADAHFAGGKLQFQPDWPAAEQVEGEVSFVADGFTVDGQGAIAGVGIERFHAGIAHFGQAELEVQADGGGDAASLLELLRHSPLRKPYGETLDNLSARGPTRVGFDLRLPLHRDGGPMRLGGRVELRGAQLTERRWKLAFTGVSGRADYSRSGFAANRLVVRHAGAPGKLTLRAGDFTRDRRQAFEAQLEANLGAGALLQHAEALAWLQPYLDGRSPWTIAVALPKSLPGKAAPPTRLVLRSNLVGTALRLPAPLRKPAQQAWPTTIELALPFERGEVRVALADRLGLRARSVGDRTGVRIVLGSERVAEPPPASGLVVTGRAAQLDALDWISVLPRSAAADGDDGGVSLRQVDVTAAQLRVLGAVFPDTRLQVLPADGGTSVQVQGAHLAGTVQVPNGAGAPVTGRFERVHWRAARAGAGTETELAAAVAAGPEIDPAKVPALALDIDALRVGDAALGRASLRTQPAADGMRIERLQTRAPKQRIDLSGDWQGRGPAARTRLQVEVDSDDFGVLLDGFGFGGQLAGGDGRARFDASWPGSPAAFRLDALDGSLALAVEDGRLLEIEAGAGRVLGLLSLAQLPRRLMLDFRDFFFKGFAYNRIDGHVHLAAGTARSDDLRIDGPAARITIRGTADLRAQAFDQTIEVVPKTGNLLTVAGAIAGGPVGAAIGAAANAVLNKPIGQMTAKTYRVTGPWKEPKVEVIRREPATAPASDGVPDR